MTVAVLLNAAKAFLIPLTADGTVQIRVLSLISEAEI